VSCRGVSRVAGKAIDGNNRHKSIRRFCRVGIVIVILFKGGWIDENAAWAGLAQIIENTAVREFQTRHKA
jgi:hypothetical protein